MLRPVGDCDMSASFRGPIAGLLVAALMCVGAVQARAQMSLGGGGGGPGGGHAPAAHDDEPKKPAPPPAIPGAVASPDAVAPASKTAKDLDPNAALFDAIDRGDLTAARDALNRGADLNARNVLGQRPLDMSIDLSRNPITFLLLSMRSQIGGPESGAQQAGDPADDAAEKPAAAPVRRRGRRVPVAAPVQVATRSTDTSGAPQPSAGFLGFGSH